MRPLDVHAESERNRVRITAVKAMELKDSAGQSLVKIETDAGICGYGEAGAPGPTARAHIREMEPFLIGADPLGIDRLFNRMVDTFLDLVLQTHLYSQPLMPFLCGVLTLPIFCLNCPDST